jgi:hypothetical protein
MTYDLEAHRRDNGEFGNKPFTEAEEGVVTPVIDPSVTFGELNARVESARTELVHVAGQALSSIIKDRYPNATSITVIDAGSDGNDDARHLVLATVKAGEETLLDTTLGDGDEDFLEAVGEWTPTLGQDINALHRVKKNKIWGLPLDGEVGTDAVQKATAARAELTDLAENGNKRLGELARKAVADAVKEKFPNAVSVTLVNENSDGDGWPYLTLQSVQDASGKTIFDAEVDDDYEFLDEVNDLTVSCDRDLDALENIDEGWEFEGTWRLRF